IDIRDPKEYKTLNIESSINIPIEELYSKASNFPANIPVIVICEVGKSSLDQIRMLKRNKINSNLINLKGGINEWFNKKSP
ncbi:MAG TPA: rhodanese-like domain-containing protein, partial [Bacteroidetes bacterium]|nr:rhodanese-like domain-containing protein [Bacteroidota bacterium]